LTTAPNSIVWTPPAAAVPPPEEALLPHALLMRQAAAVKAITACHRRIFIHLCPVLLSTSAPYSACSMLTVLECDLLL
jgi:hypothetical protein